MTVLITGGLGFIGSHLCVALSEAGYDCLIVDNLSNAQITVVERLNQLTRRRIHFREGDVRDGAFLAKLFRERRIASVMHLAALKSVGDSVRVPLEYYDNNVNGSLRLLAEMQKAGVRTLIFSSSAAVYGNPRQLPLTESAPRHPITPYGRTKLVVEDALEDLHKSDPTWRIARLRYFNPIGAHPSGMIGEATAGTPDNLAPYIMRVASGQQPMLRIWGGDYPTPDGTGVRDYIHVTDVADGHVAALRYLDRAESALLTVNLGTGRGFSVLDVLAAFTRATGRNIPYRIFDRRVGDVAECWADASCAKSLLGWVATKGLDEMCRDAWRWHEMLPAPSVA
jgi:UDP-glucose 4-epimerase